MRSTRSAAGGAAAVASATRFRISWNVSPAYCSVRSRATSRTSLRGTGSSSARMRLMPHPVSVARTTMARSPSTGMRSTRSSRVCWSGGARITAA